jgi:hypothetical protein
MTEALKASQVKEEKSKKYFWCSTREHEKFLQKFFTRRYFYKKFTSGSITIFVFEKTLEETSLANDLISAAVAPP